jgi:PGF-pre-PGF domain-containing protein
MKNDFIALMFAVFLLIAISSTGSAKDMNGIETNSISENNVQAKDSVQIIADNKNVTVNFNNNTGSIEEITFRWEKIMDKTRIIVSKLKNNLNSIPYLPEGKVYKFFNICIKADDLNCIRNETINFNVNISELKRII